MNCAGIIKFQGYTQDAPLVISESLYKICVERWGEKEVAEMNIVVNKKMQVNKLVLKK
jgi:hypothetical protein